MFVKLGDVVLVSLRDFQDDKCDIIHIYNQKEAKELVKIDEAGLHYKKSIRKYGKSTLFLFGNIQDLQFDVPQESSIQRVWESSPWINGGERFSFSYFGKIVKFGRKLEEQDCKLLFNLVNKRIIERKKK